MKLPWSKSKDAKEDSEVTSSPSNTDTGDATPNSDKPSTKDVSDKEIESNQREQDKIENHAEATAPDATTSSEGQDISEKRQTVERTDSTATASSAGETEDTTVYKSGSSLYLLTFGLALATFVVALDNTIIATAIPRITTVFDSLNDVGWYGSSYLLTTTSLQPSFGKIYTYFSVKWTYISALMIFELGSVLCGAAVNSTMLIVGRAVAGVGAAALFSGGMTIVAYSVPLHRRPIYIGLLSSMFGKSLNFLNDYHSLEFLRLESPNSY